MCARGKGLDSTLNKGSDQGSPVTSFLGVDRSWVILYINGSVVAISSLVRA
jgi:hypothetical protein